MNPEVLKQYLVSLGFDINKAELQHFGKSLKDAEGFVGTMTTGMASKVSKFYFGVISAFTAVSTGVLAMADSVAQADQKYRLMGQRMFMTTQQARSLQMGLDALGVTLEEASWDPETNNRLSDLLQLQERLAKGLGSNFEKDMRGIRDVRFEFSKLKVAMQYLGMRFVASLFEKMGLTAQNAGAKIEELVDWLAKKLPEAADKVSAFFIPILQDTWEILKGLGGALKAVSDAFVDGSEATEKFRAALTGTKSEVDESADGFDRFSKAVLFVVDGFADFVNYISSAIEQTFHLIDALNKLLKLDFEGAGKQFKLAFAPAPKTMRELRELNKVQALPATNEQEQTIHTVESAQAATRPVEQQPPSEVASKAREMAMRAGSELGIDPKLIFEQWQHETGGFKNRGARDLNNLAGVTKPGGSGVGYRKFESLEEFEQFYVKMLRSKRYTDQGILKARNEEEFAGALKRGGYYEDKYENYVKGMKSFAARSQDLQVAHADGAKGIERDTQWARSPNAGGSGEVNVTVNVGGVNVAGTNASPKQIQDAVASGATAAINRHTQRTLAQLAFVS